MNIVLNGKACETSCNTLAELVAALDYTDEQIATALNSEFVPRTRRQEVQLNEGDQVEIIAPMAGG